MRDFIELADNVTAMEYGINEIVASKNMDYDKYIKIMEKYFMDIELLKNKYYDYAIEKISKRYIKINIEIMFEKYYEYVYIINNYINYDRMYLLDNEEMFLDTLRSFSGCWHTYRNKNIDKRIKKFIEKKYK